MAKVIWKSKDSKHRILEHHDLNYSLNDLLGDSFCPKVNYNMDASKLALEKIEFLDKVESEGVYGYELQEWNPVPDTGWQGLESCWGFVGTYEDEEHYIDIVEEMKGKVEK